MEEYQKLVLGSFVPSRLHLSMHASESAIGNNKYNTLEFHEIWHFFQTCMTAFGQKNWNIYRQSIGFIYSEWKKLTSNSGHSPRLPLGHLASLGNSELAHSFLLYNAFMGSAGIACARSSTRPSHRNIKDLSILTYDCDWPIKPTVTIGGKNENIEGVHVIEGQAIVMESIYGQFLNEIPPDETLDRSTVPEKYFICIDYFIEKLGAERFHEFPAVCDLALQAHWTEPVANENEWRSSHPGWRFVKIIEKIIENNIRLDHRNIKYEYENYCNEITNSCGYKSIKETLLSSIDTFSHGCLLKTDERMLEALKFRYENLICGAYPFLNIDIWMKMKEFKPSTIQRKGKLAITVDGEEEVKLKNDHIAEGFFLETMGELHLQAFVAQILGQRHSECSDKQISCGYKFFNIEDGCQFQATGQCDGRIESGHNPPVVSMIDKDGNFSGCIFVMAVSPYKLSISDLSVDFSSVLPTLSELKTKEFTKKK